MTPPKLAVSLVAITFMLESWLLADNRAIAAFLTKQLKNELSGSLFPQ
jgi:hypothetical protein